MLINTKNPKNTIIESKATDAFDSNIESDIVLSTINKFIITLENEHDVVKQQEIIETFYRKMKSWEIITVQSKEGQRIWIQVPFIYEKKTIINGLMKRIGHLFETGVWLPEKSVMHIVDAKSNYPIPMTLHLQPEHIEIMKMNQSIRILTIVKELRHFLLDVLDKGYTNLGIFRKPEGVIAMNQTKAWLTEYENKLNITWHMKHTMEVQSMYDLINQTKFKTQMITHQNIAKE